MFVPVIRTQPEEKIVAYFSTRNLYDMLPAAYNSLLAYSPDVHVYCFIEDDTLPFTTPPQVTCVNVTNQTLFPRTGPCFRTKYTYMVLLKTALTKIFPDAERAVILDVDTIVCADISPLFSYDLTHAYYAAVTEPEGSRLRGVPYANFGVVLLNLAKLRSSGKDDDIITELNTKYHPYPEQDAFNIVCGNRFDPLPPDYNVTRPGFDITGNPAKHIVRHFAGFNDWSDFEIVQYWRTHTAPPPRYVVYAGNRKYYPMMTTAAKSLLLHTQVDRIFFLIEDDTFPEPLPPVFTCINVSKQTIFPLTGPNITSWYGYMTTLRAGLTHILPAYVDKVLWLDPDTLVYDDISDIYNYDLQYHYFAAVEEVRNHNHTRLPYYNAGVMFMNLGKMQNDGVADRIITDINTTRYEHLEQDALNFNCSPHILPLPSGYSESFVSAPCKHPYIHHFLAREKFDLPKASASFRDLTWNDIPNASKGDDKHV